MSHLGRWLSALVDGELDEAERDHVLNHLAGCGACRREANELRALKRRMTALGDTSAASTVLTRLLDLGQSEPQAAPSGWPARAACYPNVGRSRPGLGGWKVATGSAGAVFAAVGLAALLLGTPPGAPRPQISPAVEMYWLEHVHDMGQAPTRPGTAGPAGPAGPAPAAPAGSKPAAAKPSAAQPSGHKAPAVRRLPAAARSPARPAHRASAP